MEILASLLEILRTCLSTKLLCPLHLTFWQGKVLRTLRLPADTKGRNHLLISVHCIQPYIRLMMINGQTLPSTYIHLHVYIIYIYIIIYLPSYLASCRQNKGQHSGCGACAIMRYTRIQMHGKLVCTWHHQPPADLHSVHPRENPQPRQRTRNCKTLDQTWCKSMANLMDFLGKIVHCLGW